MANEQDTIALQNLELNTLLNLATTEAQFIWRRYSAMLTANSIVGAVVAAIFLSRLTDLVRLIVVILLAVFGLLLSICWLVLTTSAWELEHKWVDAVVTKWPGDANPFVPYKEWCTSRGTAEGKKDTIGRYSRFVIVLFIVAYSLAALSALIVLIVNRVCP